MSVEIASVWRHNLYDFVFVVTRRSDERQGYDDGYIWWWRPLDDPQDAARWVTNPWWESSFAMFAERIA